MASASVQEKYGWELKAADLAFVKDEESCLGRGGYGEVYRGKWRGTTVAIKSLILQRLTARARKEFIQEIEIMWKLRHPSLVQLFGAVVEPNFHMVMELMEGGSLYHLLQDDDKALSWLRRVKIMLDVAAGVDYLHSNNIVHRDIKSLNVLLDRELNPKLCDFGLALIKSDTESQSVAHSRAVGTVRWLAPEVMQGAKHSKRSDIWALGLIGAELATRAVPFADAVEAALTANLSRPDAQNLPLGLPEDCPADLSCSLETILLRDPTHRPSAPDVVEALTAVYEAQCAARGDESAGGAGDGRDSTPSAASGRQVRECVVCMSEPRYFRFGECGHSVLCRGCMETFMLRSRPQCPNCRAPVSRQHLIEGDDVAREHTFVHNVGARGAGGGRDSTTPAALAGRPAHLEAVFQLERQLDAMRLRAEEERLEAEARAERARRFEEARLAALREEVRAAQAERAALQASQAEEERAGRRHSAEAAARGARAAYSASSFFTQHGYQGQRGAAPSTGFSTGLRHSSSGSANGRELMQGPRGGLYYINSNGNKTYVRQK